MLVNRLVDLFPKLSARLKATAQGHIPERGIQRVCPAPFVNAAFGRQVHLFLKCKRLKKLVKVVEFHADLKARHTADWQKAVVSKDNVKPKLTQPVMGPTHQYPRAAWTGTHGKFQAMLAVGIDNGLVKIGPDAVYNRAYYVDLMKIFIHAHKKSLSFEKRGGQSPPRGVGLSIVGNDRLNHELTFSCVFADRPDVDLFLVVNKI